MIEFIRKHPFGLLACVIVVVWLIAGHGETPQEAPPKALAAETGEASDTPQQETQSAPAVVEDPAEWLNVAGRVPLPGDALRDQITVFFDAPIVAPEDSTEPLLTITPPLEGELRVGANSLSYLLAKPAPELTVIHTVTLNPALRSESGKMLNPKQREFIVAEFVFEPKNVFEIEDAPERTVLGLFFSTPVEPGTLNNYVSARGSDGQLVAVKVEAGNQASSVRLVLPAAAHWPVELTLQPGIPDASGTLTTMRPYTYLYPSDAHFEVASVNWGSVDADKSRLLVGFSKTVGRDEFERCVSVKDKDSDESVAFELPNQLEPKPSDCFILVLPTDRVKGKTLVLTLDGSLSGAGHRTLENTFERTISWETKPLSVATINLEAFKDPQQQRLAFTFSSPVDAKQLRDHLTLTGEGENIPFEVATEGVQTTHQVVLTVDQPLLEVHVELTQGLAGTDMSVLKETYSRAVSRPTTEHKETLLRVENGWWNSWRAQDDKEGMEFELHFNTQILPKGLQEHVSIDPALENMRVEVGSYASLSIFGEWRSKQEYTITFSPGLLYQTRANQETPLAKPLVHHFKSEKVPSYLGVGYEGKWYFPRRADGSLPIQSRNLHKAHISLSRMFPSNVVVALRDMNMNEQDGGLNDLWCERIKTSEIELAYQPDRLVETPLPLDPLFPSDKKGLFALSMSGDKGGHAAKLLLWTDIGVLAHWDGGELVAFVHNLFSLAPIPSAQVTAYSQKNQFLGLGATDGQGMVRLGPFAGKLGSPSVLVVENGDDYTFLELKPREEGDGASDSGLPRYNREGYDAFVYADRDLYRPGETVHARWIVRTHYSDPVPGVPLLVKVIKPNGRVLQSETTTLSPLGTGELDIVTEKTHPTGKYTIQLSTPGGGSLGSYQFSLEEFVPNRMKATVTVAESYWLAGTPYKIFVEAQHLFGAPAADRKCEAGVTLRPNAWKPDQWKDYRFDNDAECTQQNVPCGEAQTGADGKAVFDFNYAAPSDATSPMEATVIGSVLELGGRPVTNTTRLMYFPSEVCLGLNMRRDADTNEIEVFAAAVKPDQTPADLPSVKVTLEKRVWNYYVRRYYSHYESDWSESFQEIETRDVPLTGGKGSTRFTLAEYGNYRVRVHSEATPQYSTRSFYSYGHWFRVEEGARPSLITLTLDKDLYQVGEEAQLKIQSPFDGKGIVVVQGEDIQRMIPVDIKDNVGLVSIPLGAEQIPNVWVEVTVIHAVQEERTQVYPFSSFAMANIKVQDSARRLVVGFPFLPAEVRPAQQTSFAVETLDAQGNPVPAEVTVAAVDEGIHGITNYKTPDPFSWLFRPRSVGLSRAHYYDKVAYDFQRPAIGGDGVEGLMAKSLPTIDENWIRPVALWSGVVHTDANGQANVVFDVPEFTGQLRLVAVACTETALGSNAGNVFVRRPYMLRTSMPRFLLPGDTAQCRAVLFNHTGAPCKATVQWTVGGVLTAATGSQDLDVPASGEASLLADIAAANAMGQGELRWEVVVKDEQGVEVEHLSETAPIPVRAPGSFQTHHETVVLAPGETREFRNTFFLDDERAEIELTVGSNPVLRLQEALKYCVGYPYGCIEQTTSRLLPMYLLRRVSALAEMPLDQYDSLHAYIQAGIDRLFLMQTFSGGLAMWPGGSDPYPYGSVYALHFLTLAQNDHEFDLPEENFKALQKYVNNILDDWTGSKYSDLHSRAYALYVLALGGDLDAVRQIERFDAIIVPRAARYLLAAALAYSTQDSDRVKAYLAEKPSEPYAVREIDGTLNSDIRNQAVVLLALCQIKGDPSEMATKADNLLQWIEEKHHGNTQETAFVVSALSLYLESQATDVSAAAATVKAPDGDHEIRATDTWRGTHQGAGGLFTVVNTGQPMLYVDVVTRGVPENVDAEPVSEGGMNIERLYHTPEGKTVEDGVYTQGDSYVVTLKLTATKEMKNIVVADVLPAGFEIENPRLQPDALPDGKFASTITPTFLDVRDDRLILAFGQLPRNEQVNTFYYVVRAVTPGKYSQPAVQADCMYDATIHANNRPRVIEVK